MQLFVWGDDQREFDRNDSSGNAKRIIPFLLIATSRFGMIICMSDSIRQPKTAPRLHVILEPRAGHTLQEILFALEQADAMEIDQISAKFISAEITPSSVPSLKAIAFVETKKPHGLA